MIHSDEVKLRQILTNLVTNALKYTTEGYVEFGYDLKYDSTGEMVEFYVKDTGIGIAPDEQLIIFERFRQLDNPAAKKYQSEINFTARFYLYFYNTLQTGCKTTDTQQRDFT